MKTFQEYLKERKSDNGLELPQEIIDFLGDALYECADLEEWQWSDVEEIESKSRDGFWAYTDGGCYVNAQNTVDMMIATGYIPKALEKQCDRFQEDAREEAIERTKEEYPEIADWDDDDIDYSNLYDNDKGEIAEFYSECESEYMSDIYGDFQARVQYYSKDNRNGDFTGKSDSMTVIAQIGFEGFKNNEEYAEENFKVDLSTPKGIKKAEKDIEKALKKVTAKVAK